MPVISTLQRWRQDDHKSKVTLNCIATGRPAWTIWGLASNKEWVEEAWGIPASGRWDRRITRAQILRTAVHQANSPFLRNQTPKPNLESGWRGRGRGYEDQGTEVSCLRKICCAVCCPSICISQDLSMVPCTHTKSSSISWPAAWASLKAGLGCMRPPRGPLVSKAKSTSVIYLKHTPVGLGKGLADLVKRCWKPTLPAREWRAYVFPV